MLVGVTESQHGFTRELRQCNVAHFSHNGLGMEALHSGNFPLSCESKNRPSSGHDMIHLFLPVDTKTSWKFYRRSFCSASTGRGGHSTPHFEALSKTLRLSTGSRAIRSRRRGHDSDFGLNEIHSLHSHPSHHATPIASALSFSSELP
jgi:hypothetical protein